MFTAARHVTGREEVAQFLCYRRRAKIGLSLCFTALVRPIAVVPVPVSPWMPQEICTARHIPSVLTDTAQRSNSRLRRADGFIHLYMTSAAGATEMARRVRSFK